MRSREVGTERHAQFLAAKRAHSSSGQPQFNGEGIRNDKEKILNHRAQDTLLRDAGD